MREQGEYGVVSDLLPNLCYSVTLDTGKEIKCHLSGKMRSNQIKVYIGDRVEVIVDPYEGKMTNRIIKRLR